MEAVRFSHKIYKNDPVLYKSYVGKEVTVLKKNGDTDSGIVYTVDPVSDSIVLLQNTEQNQLKVIFGHIVENIEVCSEQVHELTELFTNAQRNILQSALEERKNALMRKLKENHFPVKDNNGILEIMDVLVINPPYEANDCVSTNSIILERIQTFLSSVTIDNE